MYANAKAITRARQIAKDYINRVGDWYDEKAISRAIEYMEEIYNLPDDPQHNCIAKVFVLVKADAFGDKMDQYEVFSSFKAANEWMRMDFISQQRKEEMADSMGVMKDDPAFFRDQHVPSSDSESAELFLGESHVVRWCIYEKELIAEGANDADE